MDYDHQTMKIMKFGGTSVGSVEMIKRVARLISNEEPKVVVLSAMSGTTNALVEIASKLSAGDIAGATCDIENLEKEDVPWTICCWLLLA